MHGLDCSTLEWSAVILQNLSFENSGRAGPLPSPAQATCTSPARIPHGLGWQARVPFGADPDAPIPISNNQSDTLFAMPCRAWSAAWHSTCD